MENKLIRRGAGCEEEGPWQRKEEQEKVTGVNMTKIYYVHAWNCQKLVTNLDKINTYPRGKYSLKKQLASNLKIAFDKILKNYVSKACTFQ